MLIDKVIESGILPDWALRYAVRIGLKRYSNRIKRLDPRQILQVQSSFLKKSLSGSIALSAAEANVQHYEVPVIFFEHVLGRTMKYSGSYWQREGDDIEVADNETLDNYIDKASIENGHSILDLGAGWGSLAIKMADRYRNSEVKALTNSSIQKNFIDQRAKELGLVNIKVIKSDINDFKTHDRFDRITSIEMFEHLRNPKMVIGKINEWLDDEGKLFIQVFSHRSFPQFFDNAQTSWMSRHFFTNGMMPYKNFYNDLQIPLQLDSTWTISGIHYHKTLEFWLSNLHKNKKKILSDYNDDSYLSRYRLFLIFCSELFRFNEGKDWFVAQHLFSKRVDIP